ncbi:HCL040Cp [Eremothecium sinecaudum]|uniref:HCL040Cp n=1 Tax=Eremothecium sinecaudum TaxID=45286 RepID=A0A0X8HQH9_9SACH|nr:HCL040Cp [Eremothecium sinecaudum]AMD20111.1 HCL040Cp [Eremothecium sinecaudum]
MSTIQQVKQITKTKTKTAITTEQSQKLIQTMLTMSFGCLAFLRGLFPDDSFVDQKFVAEKCNASYDKLNAASIRIKTLVRGKSDEADMFLDWLEKGVFTAIKMRYLKAISLGIFTDKSAPQDLLESYIFSFDYPTSSTVNLHINEHDEAISLLDSRKMMQQLMRRFIIITQSLDPLPRERYLTMRLLFNDSAPADYQPEFFKDASLEPAATIKIPISTDMDTVSVGSLNTLHHTVGLKVLSLVDIDPQECENPNIKAVDPFKLVTETPELKVDPIDASRYNSQTTNMLQDYLRSPSGKICPTQAINLNEDADILECECRSPCSDTFIKRCNKCSRTVHGLCYGNSRSSSLHQCITCLLGNEGLVDLDSKEFKVLMVTRKLFRYLKSNPSFGNSVRDLQQKLFADDKSVQTTELLNIALSIFVHDDVIIVEQHRKRNSRGHFKKESSYVDIDSEGIITPTGPLKVGRHVFTLFLGSKNAQKCYKELIPITREQLVVWIHSIKKSISNLNRNKYNVDSNSSSLNLSSLAIDDTANHVGVSKRKNNDYGESNIDIDYQSNPKKVRKISVSKKTLKSTW